MNTTTTTSSVPSRASVGILDTKQSPHVLLRSIGMGECRWTTGFWAEKFRQCEEVMVPYMGTVLKGEIGHALNNFLAVSGARPGAHEGTAWHDGDFYKWMEASVHVYAVNGDQRLLTELDEMIAVVAAAQQPDGYIETYNQLNGIAPFTHRHHHELYNAGHLLTSACIHHRVTGQTNFLDVAVKMADYLDAMFSPRPARLARFGFNQTQIMGLVELYRTTREERYLKLAELFIDMRGQQPVEPGETVDYWNIGDMVQERTPLRESSAAVGHAVLALYFYAGAADVAAETGEKALVDALDRIWNDVVERKMYVTGACGQAHHGSSSQSDSSADFVHEAFIDEYMMPNLTAYNETCANLANAMFSHRMLGIHGESKFADIMELVLFNSGLSGIGLDGTSYIYANPLRALHGARDYTTLTTETPDRRPYLDCFCCPPNIVRTIAQLSGWAYSIAGDGVAVNLFGGNELSSHLPDGSTIRLHQETDYPWDGAVRLVIDECRPEPFDVLVRVPGWAAGATLRVNGERSDVPVVAGSFATVRRAWTAGDVIDLDLPMKPELIVGHRRIEEVRNQAAVRRGPVVYCVETPDLPEGVSVLDVHLPSDVDFDVVPEPTLLNGVTSLRAEFLLRTDRSSAMYTPLAPPEWTPAALRLVPYFAWSNRGTSEMTVWMPLVWR